MSGFICNKPMKLSGRQYFPGDLIPAGAVLPSRESTLKKNGLIVSQPETVAQAPAGLPEGGGFDNFPIELQINASEGPGTVTVGSKAVAEAFAILQLSEKEAKIAIGKAEDGDVLTIVGAADHRKNVLTAVKERQSKLNEEDTTETAEPTEEAGGADGADV